MSRHAGLAALALPLAAVALLAAGCGGGSKSPSVANLGSTTDRSSTSSGTGDAPQSGGSATSGSGGGPRLMMQVGKAQDARKFSACMRSHGVPNFPDPNGEGGISIGPSSGIDPRSPKFQAAQKVCRKVLPNGGQPTPAQAAKARQSALAFSACMRRHGVKDFPDPQFSGGRVSISIHGSPGSDLDPSSPVFQAAQKACKGNLPGQIGGK